MALYNSPLEPGLILSVNNTQLQNQVITPQGLNVAYLLTEQPALGTLLPNAKNLVTSLINYRNLVGGVPTTYAALIDYLSVAAFFANTNGAGLLQIVPVKQPLDVSTLTIAAVSGIYTSANYSLSVNGEVLNRTVALSGLPATYNAQVAADLALAIQQNPILNSVIYIRKVNASVIELAPYISGTIISFTFATPTIVSVGTFNIPAASFIYVQTPPLPGAASVLDYGQSLYTAISEDSELGYIFAPGFFATNTTSTNFELANLLDKFCLGSKRQHIAIIDVPNPDFVNIPLYSAVVAFEGGSAIAVNGLVRFKGSIYKAISAISAVPPAVNAAVVAVGSRIKLSTPVTFNGATSLIIQSISATASIAVTTAPTNLELQQFVPIPDTLLLSEALASGTLTVQEQSSASESGLYNWRDSFNSIEGHVSVAAPYQKYNGSEVSSPYVIPASAYLVALAIRVADSAGLSAPPASDQYPLFATAGPIWQVTSPGHALLNGKGINIIKNINNQTYVMGSRTLSRVDLYNRLNNRQILSAYVKTLTLALNQGIVLRALDSTGIQLSAIKTQMDRVSEAFYLAKLFDGITSGDAYRNVCSNLNNSITDLQQGVVKAESIVTQIGMIEQLRVTITETLLGS